MQGANSFARVIGTTPMTETPRRRSPSRSRQASNTNTQSHSLGGVVGIEAPEQPSLSRSRLSPRGPQRDRSPVSSRTQYGASCFTMRQETNCQATSSNDRAKMFLDTDVSQSSQSQTNTSTTHYSRSRIVKSCVQRTEESCMQNAASFPIHRAKQAPPQSANHTHSPGKDQSYSATPAQLSRTVTDGPHHSRTAQVSQQIKQTRQQHAERTHIHRMTQNRTHYTAQPQPQLPEQYGAGQTLPQIIVQPQSQDKEQQSQQFSEHQSLPRADQPRSHGNEQPHSRRPKEFRSLLLEQPPIQRSEQLNNQLAEQPPPQPIWVSHRQRTASAHSQLKEKPGQILPHNIEHDHKRKQPPSPLRLTQSNSSIKVHPPTPKRPQAASISTPDLPTLSSLNVSEILPEPYTRTEEEIWTNNMNAQSFLTKHDLVHAAEKSANQSSYLARCDSLGMEHLRHSSPSSSMRNVDTERRGPWASLKTAVKKAGGLVKRRDDSAGMPPGRK